MVISCLSQERRAGPYNCTMQLAALRTPPSRHARGYLGAQKIHEVMMRLFRSRSGEGECTKAPPRTGQHEGKLSQRRPFLRQFFPWKHRVTVSQNSLPNCIFQETPPKKELLSSGAWVGEAVGAGLTGQQPKQTGFMGVEQKPLSSLFLFPD